MKENNVSINKLINGEYINISEKTTLVKSIFNIILSFFLLKYEV